jgi:hypothetical protein
MRTPNRALVAAAAAAGLVATLAGQETAFAAANVGQPVNNDYGQSAAEVNAEVAKQVAANTLVIAAKAKVTSTNNVLVLRTKAYNAAKAAYAAALKTGNATKIAAAKKTLTTATAALATAKKNYATAVTARNATVTRITTLVRGAHFKPVDGTYVGNDTLYFVPDLGFSETIKVSITVYGGHISSVTGIDVDTKSDSIQINANAYPTFQTSAMTVSRTVEGTVNKLIPSITNPGTPLATVSGASLTRVAFSKSLASAMIKAGFKA